MSLHIVRTTDERLVSAPAERVLREALTVGGRAVLLVPNFRAQLDASKELAGLGGLALGVTVSTPPAWAKERWEVWGDGTRPIEAVTRTIALQQVLAGYARRGNRRIAFNAGTVNVLARLVSRSLPWLPLDPAGRPDAFATSLAGLTRAEREVVEVAGSYARLVHSLGCVEEGELMARVPDALVRQGVPVPPVVLVGFGELSHAERTLVAELAAQVEVTLVSRQLNARVGAHLDRSLALVAEEARAAGVEVAETADDAARPSRRSQELLAVGSELFSGRPGQVEAGDAQAVSLATAAGPTAEAELVAGEVARLAHEGCAHVVVSVPDARRAWRELAPKLWARGLVVGAQLSVPAAELEAGRAFLEFAAGVARLGELDATWPLEQDTEEGSVIRLGDMLWWPPSGLVDFLQSDLSGMPLSRVERIDMAWRSDRLLTPSDVLDLLQNEKRTSPAVAAATRELLKGRLGSAASKLLGPYLVPAGQGEGRTEDCVLATDGTVASVRQRPADALADAEAVGALAAVIRVAGTLKELGVTSDPAARKHVSLSELVGLAREALTQTKVVLRPEANGTKCPSHRPGGKECPSPCPTVEILGARQVAQMQPGLADALVLCGHMSAESPVDDGDDALSALLEKLGVEPARDALADERTAFAAQVAVASRHLVVERAERDGSSKECYPSVMLTELLACYRDPASVPVRSRGEQDAAANVADSGQAQCPVGQEERHPAGRISDDLRPLVVVPQEGSVELLGGRPLLSASQIETYLECPYKWFSLRRLHLKDSDAGFSAVEMGTFAHRVLEVTHRQLLQEAVAALAADGGPTPDPELLPAARIPGSRVSEDDEAGLAHARQILDEEFDVHLRHQFLRRGKRSRYQAFVPHTSQDEGMLRSLRRDLLSVLDYEAGLFVGFEPRLFEWGFGRHGELVPYAGAYLTGTIDRVDVDAHGQAIVIDYKHKGSGGFAAEYGVFGEEGQGTAEAFALPRRVQSLIYGQVVRRHRPDLAVVAATYLATKGQDHALSGAVSQNALDAVYGTHAPTDRQGARVAVAGGHDGMAELLDATEEAIAEQVGELVRGNIEARPRDAAACSFCPVMNCERRLSR